MKNQLLLTSLLILLTSTSFAQFSNESDLLSKIKSCKTNLELNTFLVSNKLIDPKDDTAYYFEAQGVEVDTFNRNLFGDLQKEFILEIRDNNRINVNIFYHANGKFKKVPGHIDGGINADEPGSYNDVSFDCSFENIFKENEYCILISSGWEYNRTTEDDITIDKISQDTILQIYDFPNNYSSYSGVLTYDYDDKGNYEFRLLDNTYPKALIINKTFEDNVVTQQNGDAAVMLSGTESTGTRIDTIIFNNKGVKLYKPGGVKRIKRYISILQDIAEIQLSKNNCDSLNTTLYIAREFFQNYLLDIRQMPKVDSIPLFYGGGYFYKCCDVYINNRTLNVLVRDSITHNITTHTFKLKPTINELFKPDINPKRLYYFSTEYMKFHYNIDKDTIIYFKRDTAIIHDDAYTFFNFGDTSLLHYNIYDSRDIKGVPNYDFEITTTGSVAYFSLDKIAPYLKPEILDLYPKSGKKIKQKF